MNRSRWFLVICIFVCFGSNGCARPELDTLKKEAYQAYLDGDYEQAATQFEILVESIPKDAELWFRLGNVYAKSMQPEKAVSAYENALLRDPTMAKAWYNKGFISLQEALKAFADMQNYVPPDDPVARQSRVMRDRLLEIMEGPGGNGKNVD